mmetsp:Transcript_16993/g.46785  ORF Transcript_16993/g.46785 Transcript_16993/m.46785 type:complete len:246 (-) Transcript_16993:155-892(-)
MRWLTLHRRHLAVSDTRSPACLPPAPPCWCSGSHPGGLSQWLTVGARSAASECQGGHGCCRSGLPPRLAPSGPSPGTWPCPRASSTGWTGTRQAPCSGLAATARTTRHGWSLPLAACGRNTSVSATGMRPGLPRGCSWRRCARRPQSAAVALLHSPRHRRVGGRRAQSSRRCGTSLARRAVASASWLQGSTQVASTRSVCTWPMKGTPWWVMACMAMLPAALLGVPASSFMQPSLVLTLVKGRCL